MMSKRCTTVSMVSQQQATASISGIGAVLLYVLWSLVQTGSFLPYVSEFSPNVGNILLFLGLLSLVLGAAFACVASLAMTVISLLRKRESKLEGITVYSWFVVTSFTSFVISLLHVFRLIPIQFSLLSCALVCGIVLYGNRKSRNRYEKYLTTGN